MSAAVTAGASSRIVAASGGDPLAEAVELTKRLRLPHIRRHLLELVPTARAQRWDPAELVRVLLAEEAAGRDATNLRTRRARAGFPAGKTLQDWDPAASTIPRSTQDALTSLQMRFELDLDRRLRLNSCRCEQQRRRDDGKREKSNRSHGGPPV